jgi:hypothetical protein
MQLLRNDGSRARAARKAAKAAVTKLVTCALRLRNPRNAGLLEIAQKTVEPVKWSMGLAASR